MHLYAAERVECRPLRDSARSREAQVAFETSMQSVK